MEISKTFRFEASHILPHHPGKCSNLHGHSWVLRVAVKGNVDPKTGMVVDFYDVKKAVQPLIDDLDHAHLGAWRTDKITIGEAEVWHNFVKWVPWLLHTNWNPTCENLLVEIAKQLLKVSFVFSTITLSETESTSVTLTWEEFQRIMAAR